MRNYIFLFLFFFQLGVKSQEYIAISDSIPLKFGNAVFDSIGNRNISKKRLIALIKKAINLKEEYTVSTGYLASFYQQLGVVYRNTSEPDSALWAFSKGLKYARLKPTPESFVAMVESIGFLYLWQGKNSKALPLIYEAMNKIESRKKANLPLTSNKRDITNFEARINYLLSIVKAGMKEKDEEKERLLKALSLVNKTMYKKDGGLRASIYFGLAKSYYYFNQLDSSLYCYNKILKDVKLINPNTINMTKLGIVDLYLETESNLKEAEKLLYEVLDSQTEKADKNIAVTYLGLAQLYRLKKNTAKEILYLNESIIINKKSRNTIAIKNAYLDLAIAYGKIKNLKKEKFYKNEFSLLNDSIYNKYNIEALKELEVKYETQKKEVEIDYQKKLLKEEKKKKRIFLISGLLILSLLFLSLFLFRRKILFQKEILVKEKELGEQKIENLIEIHKLQSIEDKIKVQNMERERIARDLHDGIGGNLAAIKMKLEKVFERQSQEVREILTNIESTYDEVRAISHDLVLETSNFNQFSEMLSQFINFSLKKETKVAYNFFPKEEIDNLPDDLQHTIYRIIQELITNINKHSKANEVAITITKQEEKVLNIIIEDNGIGFKVNYSNNGIGIENIRKRILENGGSIIIESDLNKGTLINIDLKV